MDTFLQETASKVSDKINDASNLLDFISLIPASRSDELLTRLDDAQQQVSKTSSSSKEEPKKSVHDQLSTLWFLEETKGGTNNHQRDDETIAETTLTSSKAKMQKEKRTKLLLHATASLAISIRDSSQEVKDVFIDWKRRRRNENPSSVQELDNLISNMKGFVEQILKIGNEDIRTSVKEEHRLTTDLFKLSEKCKNLDEERMKMHTNLNDKERKIDEEIATMKERKAAMLEDLNDAKVKAELDIKNVEKEISTFLSIEEEKHREVMNTLETELSKEKQKLENLREKNSNELKEMMDQRQLVESKLSTFLHQCDIDKKEMEKEMQVLRDQTNNEIHERTELEQLLQLHELNNYTNDKEEATLQSVLDLERKAEAILDNAAAQLQKLYRGMRDRALVKKLKKKSKKGKKKGKKSKGKK